MSATSPSSPSEELGSQLRSLLGSNQVSTGESVRALHGEDLSFHPPCLPDAVVFAQSVSDVAGVLAFGHEHRIPVVPFGAGSSLEGHILPVQGGISLDTSALSSILAIRPTELTATAQAGVTRLTLERALSEYGLFLPVDPGADASLGGMAATNAAGTMTFRYGKMRSRILALEAVLPGGRVIRTGSRAAKTSAGYDLTGLLVGSEGTLGVITELTVALEGIPESLVGVRASFATTASAAAAAHAVVASGIEARRIEFIDEWEIGALNRVTATGLRVLPLLMIEIGGARETTLAVLPELVAVLADHGGLDVAQADTPAQCRALWKLRSDVFHAERLMAPGRRSVSTDSCVPLDHLGEALMFTRQAIERWGLLGGIVAHAGDGNIHTGLLVDPDDIDEMGRLSQFLLELTRDTLERDGTCTGEHGIGMGKREALRAEHGDQIDLMWAIKRAFDPHLIMNPGKVLPAEP